MKDKVVSSREGSKEETPQNVTPIFIVDLIIKIMEGNKTWRCFKPWPLLVSSWVHYEKIVFVATCSM
jgi:hypothetical protein